MGYSLVEWRDLGKMLRERIKRKRLAQKKGPETVLGAKGGALLPIVWRLCRETTALNGCKPLGAAWFADSVPGAAFKQSAPLRNVLRFWGLAKNRPPVLPPFSPGGAVSRKPILRIALVEVYDLLFRAFLRLLLPALYRGGHGVQGFTFQGSGSPGWGGRC